MIITDFCRNVVDSQETHFAFQLAAYELVENLVKYSTNDHVVVEISVISTRQGPELLLVTKNQATPERLHDADVRFSAAESAVDPVAHFDQLVQQSIKTPGESRLGLGRLRAEGDLLLSHRIEENTLIVEVRRPVYRGIRDSETAMVNAPKTST